MLACPNTDKQNNPGTRPGCLLVLPECKKKASQGFTTLELVVVIVLAGILVAIAVPRFSGGTGFDERTFRDRTIAALRYGQKAAIASRRTVCATFSSSLTQVTFNRSSANGAANCAGGVPLVGPDGNALVVVATAKAQFSSQPSDIVFDAGGRPGSGATISVSGLPASLAITVEAETGYVH